MERTSLRGKLIKTVAREFLYKQVFTPMNLIETGNDLQEELNKHLSFDPLINNIRFDSTTRLYSGNISFIDEDGNSRVSEFVVKPKAIN